MVQRGAGAVGRLEAMGPSSGAGSRFSFRLSGQKTLRPGKFTKRHWLPGPEVCLG